VTRLLVIDDDTPLRDAIAEILTEDGYDVGSAPDGAAGLALAYQDPPDLVLCDLKMRGIDGYEVLASLRRDPRTAVVPVIFLTGVGGEGAVRKGMTSGADDYLVKPVTSAVLCQTVRARLARSLEVRHEAARRLTDLRQELARSLLPHELLTPLTAVMGLASLLTEDGAIEPGQVKEVAAGILLGAQDLEAMITKFLLYAEIQTSQAGQVLGPPRAAAVVEETVRRAAGRVGREPDVEIDVQGFSSPMSADHLQAMVQELVENALEFSEAGSRVTVRARHDGDACLLTVEDRGRGMTDEQIAGLESAPFLRRNQNQPGIGLGLTIVRKLAGLYGGDVSFDTAGKRGTTASVRFPAPGKPAVES
jgi:signal transduction histidine kinase